jgi:hypothetical protein
MVPSVQERMVALRGGQDALRREMEQLTRAGPMDEAALQRLCEIGRNLQEQAHSLLVMMLYENAPGDLIQEAESLVSVFSDAVQHLEARRAPDKPAS